MVSKFGYFLYKLCSDFFDTHVISYKKRSKAFSNDSILPVLFYIFNGTEAF